MSELGGGPRSQKVLVLGIDLIIVYLSYILAFYIRYAEIPERNWESFLSLSPWILLISVFFFSIYEVFQLSRKSLGDLISSAIVAITFVAFLTMAGSYLFREFALPRSVILIASIISILLMTLWKYLFIKLNQQFKKTSVLIIGDSQETSKLISQIGHPLFNGTEVKTIHSNTDINRLFSIIHKVDYIFVCSNLAKEKKSDIIYYAVKNGKVIYVIPTLYELLMVKSHITSVDDTMVMAVKPFGLTWEQKFIKRAFDIIVSIIILIASSPIFLLVSIFIKFENPKGSIFYKQKRIGKGNEEFTILKFRSMIENAESISGPVLASRDDTRVTKVGKLIRATRLDELPQLINVIKGDMSLVGPRPEREYFINTYKKLHESYEYRNTVRPGITGYAQIMGRYSTDVKDKLTYDLYYIRSYHFWLDIVILLRTIIVLFNKSKADGKDIKDEKEDIRQGSNKQNITYN